MITLEKDYKSFFLKEFLHANEILAKIFYNLFFF
jgi:hypothetical protein